MKKEFWAEFLMVFLVCTACICIMTGILGVLFMPEEKFGYEAFFSPPLIGALTVLCGFVIRSKKELSVKQVLFRRGWHLIMVEGIFFGLNYLAGNHFELALSIILAVANGVVFIMVYVIMYINDRRNASLFNAELKKYQQNAR